MTINELIKSYPTIKIEDGYQTPPSITQSTKEEGAWVRASRTPKSGIWFMLNEETNSQLIFPGNIILVDKNKNFTSNMVEIPFTAEERKILPLDARYSNEMGDTKSNLKEYTRSCVNAYISNCLTNFKKGSHDLSSNTKWIYESSERVEGISIGGSIKSIDFAGDISHNKTVTVAYMKQEMYQVSLDNTISESSDIFTDKVNIEKFRNNITKGGSGTPAIIDTVKYGRIVALWVVQEGNQAPTISIDKFKLSIGKTNKTTRYYLRVYGGVAGDQKFNISTDSKETIKNALEEMKEVSKTAMETAVPMEYSIKYLNNMTTNVEWKVLPYYKTYIPKVWFKITEDNKGASMKVYVNALKYELRGNKLGYYKWESPKKSLDYKFFIPTKTLCIDIKVDVTGAADKYDFNIMLPCIPYDFINGPDSDGDWVFHVNVQGTTAFDTKKFTCSPNVYSAFLSTSNGFWMNHFADSPLRKYDKTTVNEKTVLQYYLDWFRMKKQSNSCLKEHNPARNVDDFRAPY